MGDLRRTQPSPCGVWQDWRPDLSTVYSAKSSTATAVAAHVGRGHNAIPEAAAPPGACARYQNFISGISGVASYLVSGKSRKGAQLLHPFEYVRATSVDEAIAALAKHGKRARPLAGGTDALVMARAGRWELDAMVDVKHIPETNVLELGSSVFRLGAAVPCYRVYEDAAIAAKFPGLVDSASIIGGIQIQSRAGLGGNLCNASPSGDGIGSLIVHHATCVIAGPNGTREVAVEDFCTGPGRSVIGDGEILVEMKMPTPKKGFGAAYERFTPRNEMDIAIAGVASSVQLNGNIIESARVALAAVGPTPILSSAGGMLAGKEATAENISAAAQAAISDASPISDMRGTVEQRKHLVGVLTRRTLERAIERARENN